MTLPDPSATGPATPVAPLPMPPVGSGPALSRLFGAVDAVDVAVDQVHSALAAVLAENESLRGALAYIAAPDDLLDANESAFNIHAARRMQAQAQAALAIGGAP
jgi:hypothetical protein